MADAGVAVATGGYGGIMEAASQGASQAGGLVIGVTCDDIENWHDVRPNQWIGEEIRVPRLRDRLIRLIEMGQGLAAFSGGVGTLSEIALTWSMLQTGTLAPRPFALVGEAWGEVLRNFLHTAEAYLSPGDAGWLIFEPDGERAADTLLRQLASAPRSI
jgi:predicted Rossmann-fold nucleotide-binding protein